MQAHVIVRCIAAATPQRRWAPPDGNRGEVPPTRTRASAHEAPLREWLVSRGGSVHPKLQLSDETECGARGVVATAPISTDALLSGALIVVPKALHFDNTLACRLIATRLAERGDADDLSAAVDELTQVQVVAAALALERRLGNASDWAPYLQSLPEEPPNPWYLTAERLDLAAQAAAELLVSGNAASHDTTSNPGRHPGQGSSSSMAMPSVAAASKAAARFRDAAQAERARYDALASDVVALLGEATGLRPDELLWAMGQVSSRSLGSGSSSGLVPFMDLLNHSPLARPPMLQLDDDDKMVMTATNVRGGDLAALGIGDELYLCYGELEPLPAWLKFGFVPSECVPPTGT